MTEAGPTGITLLPEDQVSKAGSPAGHGQTGEIWLKADSMMQGYYQDPAATAAALQDGWYKIGDVTHLDQDGYLYVVDRTKDMIVTGSENVYSK